MTLEQAKEIIGLEYFNKDSIYFARNAGSWSSFDGGDVCLDAYYDIEELEAIITIIKNDK